MHAKQGWKISEWESWVAIARLIGLLVRKLEDLSFCCLHRWRGVWSGTSGYVVWDTCGRKSPQDKLCSSIRRFQDRNQCTTEVSPPTHGKLLTVKVWPFKCMSSYAHLLLQDVIFLFRSCFLATRIAIFWKYLSRIFSILTICLHANDQVQFLGAVTRNPPFMIVTEYMYGGSLSDIFYSGKGLSLDRAVELGIDTAKGMAYLHNKNQSSVCIIHRDLKPANLMVGGHRAISSKAKANMVNETGILKIADFGLSRSIKTQLHRLHANRNVDQIIKTPVPDSAFKEGANSRGQSYKMTGMILA